MERVFANPRHTIHARAKPDSVRSVAVWATQATINQLVLHRLGTRWAKRGVRVTRGAVSRWAVRVEPAYCAYCIGRYDVASIRVFHRCTSFHPFGFGFPLRVLP